MFNKVLCAAQNRSTHSITVEVPNDSIEIGTLVRDRGNYDEELKRYLAN